MPTEMEEQYPIFEQDPGKDPEGKLNFMMEHARFTSYMESLKMCNDSLSDPLPFYIAVYVAGIKAYVLRDSLDAYAAIAAMRRWYGHDYTVDQLNRLRAEFIYEKLHDIATMALHDVRADVEYCEQLNR